MPLYFAIRGGIGYQAQGDITMDKILLLQIDNDTFYDKDGNKYLISQLFPAKDDATKLLCHICKNFIKSPLVISNKEYFCDDCLTIITLEEMFETQLRYIAYQKQVSKWFPRLL